MGQWLPTFAHDVEVTPDGFPHLLQGLVGSVTEGYASGQVRRPSAVTAVLGALDDDRVRAQTSTANVSISCSTSSGVNTTMTCWSPGSSR